VKTVEAAAALLLFITRSFYNKGPSRLSLVSNV